MKWIHLVIPLIAGAVATSAHGQWVPVSGRSTPAATRTAAGPAWPTTARLNRLIVADEPAPMGPPQETVVEVEPDVVGAPCDDCDAPFWSRHFGGCLGHKARRHCCMSKSYAVCNEPACGWTFPKWGLFQHHGCNTCVDEAPCNVCGAGCGARPKWLHGCSKCKPHQLFGCLPKVAWPWSSDCGCADVMSDETESLMPAPQPVPESAEPVPAAQPPAAPAAEPPAEPAAKAAFRLWPTPGWNTPKPASRPARPARYTPETPPEHSPDYAPHYAPSTTRSTSSYRPTYTPTYTPVYVPPQTLHASAVETTVQPTGQWVSRSAAARARAASAQPATRRTYEPRTR